MEARNELLAYLGSSLVTIVVLFGLQQWYASYIDVHVIHASRQDVPRDAKVTAQRERERGKLTNAALPIAEAKKALAERGRSAFPRIAPKPSDDLSAMSGWLYRKGFAPYQPRQSAPTTATEAGAPGELAAATPAQPGGDAQPGAAAPSGAAVEAKP